MGQFHRIYPSSTRPIPSYSPAKSIECCSTPTADYAPIPLRRGWDHPTESCEPLRLRQQPSQ
ncbi:hypothetical protein CLIM01_12343 [Colletotrichum limetticola]|uniref:Uncharacterized protein n=1 Tax=Colletotrichum limetticola TaxID=1209924 RepID=A0ABQ9PHK3_9PEZI|nr:hypothetical protein CLIM01_12343 [Colletotrichum limetticola]